MSTLTCLPVKNDLKGRPDIAIACGYILNLPKSIFKISDGCQDFIPVLKRKNMHDPLHKLVEIGFPNLSSLGPMPVPESSWSQHLTGLKFDLIPHWGTIHELNCTKQRSSTYWFQRGWKTI